MQTPTRVFRRTRRRFRSKLELDSPELIDHLLETPEPEAVDSGAFFQALGCSGQERTRLKLWTPPLESVA